MGAARLRNKLYFSCCRMKSVNILFIHSTIFSPIKQAARGDGNEISMNIKKSDHG